MKIKNENNVGQLYRDPNTKEVYKFEAGETKRVKKKVGKALTEDLRGFKEINEGGEEE